MEIKILNTKDLRLEVEKAIEILDYNGAGINTEYPILSIILDRIVNDPTKGNEPLDIKITYK